MSDTATRTRSGPGRILIAVYAIFALAAVVYIVATVCLARGNRASRRVATVSIVVELVGVLTIGTLSLVDSKAFPDATVWSGYGQGCGDVPLVLPVVGLLWLRKTQAGGR